MRLLRVVVCCLLMAAVSAAQDSSFSEAGYVSADQSGSSQDPQDPNAAPVNPLEETPKTTEETPRPKATLFDLGSGANSGKDQDLGEIRLMSRYTDVDGDETRSFRDAGRNDLAEFNYFLDRRFVVTRRLQVLSMYRGTNDHSIDPENNSLQKAYVRVYGPRDEYIFGDALVNYSRLSFNQNIKGVSLSWLLGDDWKLSTVGGVFIDRWGSIWHDLEGRPYLSNIAGMRVERRLMRDSTLGFNVSYSNDREDSLPFAAVGTSPFPTENTVTSIDAKFNFARNARLDGEFAYGFTDFDSRFASTCTAPCDSREPQPELGRQSDWAGRLEGSLRMDRVTLRGTYARFQPLFASVNARQIADLQDLVLRTSVETTDWLTLDVAFRRSNDNLRDQLPYETRLVGPEGRIILHDLPFYRRAVVELGYRHRDVEASDGSVNRFVRMPFVELTLPYRTTFFSVGYERRAVSDALSIADDSNTDRLSLSYRGVYDVNNWSINPLLRFEIERQTHRPRFEDTIPDFKIDRDYNRLATFGLFIEAPSHVAMELAYRESNATIFGPSGFARPSYRGALTYKIRNDENMQMILSYERNTNSYFTSPDYDEAITALTLVYKFGRRE